MFNLFLVSKTRKKSVGGFSIVNLVDELMVVHMWSCLLMVGLQVAKSSSVLGRTIVLIIA